MVYCGREHQVEHFPEHKSARKAIERARASLEEQEQILRDSSSSDPFIQGSINEFGPEMRSYILHRCVLVGMISGINTREAVEKQLQHSMEMLRLSPNDNLGERKTVAPMMIRLNQDRECYAFLKSWVLVSNHSYDNWSNPGLPHFDVENANIFEPVNIFLGLNIGISLTVPLFLLKLKTFLDLSLVEAQKGVALSTGPVGSSRDQAFLSTPNFTDQTTRISILSGLQIQVDMLFNEVSRTHADFWPALLNPREFLERPFLITSGGEDVVDETQGILSASYDAWRDTIGAITFVEGKLNQ
ncbi:hypothetical protein N7481_002943 [Penicillium waksmanii]|uniref:uncharacterized protein n=1 Tax=Penicillium waksmanii TaxID=69791 RepID=UPI00254920AC|nr:uncharacterized protein N7481_002943 [Penicillium waksmanii]KAJ5987733.1 hypothetical protein N7481_002943 [Penicillium waksmanii]